MMNVLLVSATSFEIEPAQQFLNNFQLNKIRVLTCITGVGMVNTAFELGKLRGQHIDLAINSGIAGSFGKFKNGEVVKVIEDRFSELGAESDTEFLSIDTMGFGKQAIALNHKFENSITEKISKAKGITVNTVHGNEATIKKIIARHEPDIETMEGAAFFHAANAFGWKALQLRAISNKVEKRNKGNWDISSAIKNLNVVIIDLIKILNEQ